MGLIAYSLQGGAKCVAQTKAVVPPGMAKKRSYHLRPRC